MPTLAAHAKVNLLLHVLAREASGYHGIETIFCRIGLADELSVEPGATGIALELEGSVPCAVEDNLVYRAATAFHDRIAAGPAVRIRLTKRIPIGAGLGGGSSDAAATLLALNRLHGSPIATDELVAIGGTLGSDVAFFMTGADLALGWGRGDRLLALDPLPVRPVLIVIPPVPMATAEAYAMLARRRDDRPRPGARSIDAPAVTSWERIRTLAANDFEPVVLRAIPGLDDMLDALRRNGATIALLSGSGSALFGIFDDEPVRDSAAAALRARFPDADLIRTVTTGPDRR
jgi:4-diphosphocytidyl-2-C-methyl-D-erythritol kinase